MTRIAVLGVGLIGGSIGLAARDRLDAEVAGFDPDGELLARAEELGAIDSGHGNAAQAVEGAEIVFCAAPVTALPGLAEEALDASGDDTAVTDVGSVKSDLIAGLGERERFVGGHPLAGAETSGVENARADLFEGARWYLTPTEQTGGLIYDRVQRAIADLGARPQAIEADAHDRLMATVSHLPHVLANVLVSQAAATASEEAERLPEAGPSFRDATRVAGANPAIWGDIFAGNREAVAAVIDAVAQRLAEAAELLRGADRDAVGAWHSDAGKRRRELLEAELAGGPLHELRVMVPNRPGIVAELALALGRAGVNIEDMALYPAADMTSGAISLYVAGDDEADRAAELVSKLGHDVSRVER
jgi:prephenate dehydrogenase